MRAAASSLTIGSDAAALANCLRRDPGREDSGTAPATSRSSVRVIYQNNNARRDSTDPAQSPSQIVPPLVRGTRKFGTSTAPTRFDGTKNSARFRRRGAAIKFRREIFFSLCILMPYSNSVAFASEHREVPLWIVAQDSSRSAIWFRGPTKFCAPRSNSP